MLQECHEVRRAHLRGVLSEVLFTFFLLFIRRKPASWDNSLHALVCVSPGEISFRIVPLSLALRAFRTRPFASGRSKVSITARNSERKAEWFPSSSYESRNGAAIAFSTIMSDLFVSVRPVAAAKFGLGEGRDASSLRHGDVNNLDAAVHKGAE
jgi:hypothetical protein